jgi:CheY-like chemotaxis protein
MAKKLLVVEDNEQNRVLMRDILTYNGYEVLEAKDGRDGVEIAKKEIPDLILMDIQMPIMDGFKATRLLKETPETKGIKIIGITSFAMRGDREKILQAGMDDYISKPINVKEFIEIIKRYLNE